MDAICRSFHVTEDDLLQIKKTGDLEKKELMVVSEDSEFYNKRDVYSDLVDWLRSDKTPAKDKNAVLTIASAVGFQSTRLTGALTALSSANLPEDAEGETRLKRCALNNSFPVFEAFFVCLIRRGNARKRVTFLHCSGTSRPHNKTKHKNRSSPKIKTRAREGQFRISVFRDEFSSFFRDHSLTDRGVIFQKPAAVALVISCPVSVFTFR